MSGDINKQKVWKLKELYKINIIFLLSCLYISHIYCTADIAINYVGEYIPPPLLDLLNKIRYLCKR
jgi:hypothetical protein